VTIQALPYSGKYIVVDDASSFPPNGLLRIGPRPGEHKPGEIIHYSSRTNTVFTDLVRGYVGTRQNQWERGSSVCGSVMAEHHNALKDAVWNIEHYLGLVDQPAENSINGIIKRYETKYLSPKPLFRAYPTVGPPPLNVRFQNFSNTDAIRFLWDFGDGTQSIERNPNHIYYDEKLYTVKLHIITSSGAQGIAKKSNYITVNKQEALPFFYIEKMSQGTRTFLFVDQTEGDIAQRYWVFDDDTQAVLVADPNEHTIIHQYQSAGTYSPSLLIVYGDQRIKRYYANTLIVE
jgi:PKD repeat protein